MSGLDFCLRSIRKIQYEIKPPCIITSRLMPGIRIGDTEISIEPNTFLTNGRVQYHYWIEGKGFKHNSFDLETRGLNLQGALEDLLIFLSACAESYAYHMHTGVKSENYDLFPKRIREWAYQNKDEIDMLAIHLEEEKDLIVVKE